MSDNPRPQRPSPIPAVFSTLNAILATMASYFMSLSRPHLFIFAVSFTAAVVFIGAAGKSWYDYRLVNGKENGKGA